jgi:hypothetical protein
MINVSLSYIHCDEETDEVGNDEPYVLVAAVALTPSVTAVPQAPLASDVVVYPFREMHTDGRAAFGAFEPFWGIGGVPTSLIDPNDAIFVVAMMENDNGDPQRTRGVVDAAVNVSLVESLAIARPGKVTTLMRDLDSARRIPTGFPNFDDAIGDPQELRFSVDELWRAENGQTVTKTMIFAGDGGRYTLMFDAQNPDKWRRWYMIRPETVFNQITPVAGLARRADHLDLFKVGSDGAVWSSWWHDGQEWSRWYQIHPETVFAQEAPVSALARRSDHLDLFVTGFDGAVLSCWWHEGQDWSSWFQIHPQTVFRQDRPVSAIARMPEHIDLFRVGFDGAIWTSWWHGEGDPEGWRPWRQIRPETLFPTEARVTALARRADHLDLFVVGHDGAVWTSWWPDMSSWASWRPIHPETVFRKDQEIAAVSRVAEHIDLFTIGHDGAVWTSWWHGEGDPEGWRPWGQIYPQTRFALTARVTAIGRRSDHLDLFVTGLNGAVWSSWWHDDADGWRPWFQVRPDTVFDQNHPVTAVSRHSEQIDLFKVGFNGAVWSAWWSPT